MTTVTPDLVDLLQRGHAAALAGDSIAARTLFRQATEQFPDSADAWIGLSGTVPVLSEKRGYLERALALQPDSAAARGGLAHVERMLAEGRLLVPGSGRGAERAAAAIAAPMPPDVVAATEVCYRHPERETGLRCVSCDRPICAECSRPAPVGQLCPECRKQRRPVNYQVEPRHLALGALAGFLVMLVTGAIYSFIGIGFFYFGLLLGPLAGEGALRASDWLTHGKRGRQMQIGVGVAMGLGGLGAMLFVGLLTFAMIGGFSPELAAMAAAAGESLSPLMFVSLDPGLLIFAIAATVTTMYRLR